MHGESEIEICYTIWIKERANKKETKANKSENMGEEKYKAKKS